MPVDRLHGTAVSITSRRYQGHGHSYIRLVLERLDLDVNLLVPEMQIHQAVIDSRARDICFAFSGRHLSEFK